jgi:hypothetical protein
VNVVAIRLPLHRAYYSASPSEAKWILYWLPREEIVRAVQNSALPPEAIDHYPCGAEIEVSDSGIETSGIRIPVDPQSIIDAYAYLDGAGRLPQSRCVKADYLEDFARAYAQTRNLSLDAFTVSPVLPFGPAPEPDMSSGEEPILAYQRIKDGASG